MTDLRLGLFNEDFNRYTIGFTENHYQASSELEVTSPPPYDPNKGFHSPALEHAERHNRGEEKYFKDQSFILDKQRSRSVSKIHNNILDLMFELTERRKSTSQGMPMARSWTALDFSRPGSNESLKSSSSMPLIQVQQLPPLLQSGASMPNVTNDDDILESFPDINSPRSSKKLVKGKKERVGQKKAIEHANVKPEEEYSPRIYEVVKSSVQKQKTKEEKRLGYKKGSGERTAAKHTKRHVKENDNHSKGNNSVKFVNGNVEECADVVANDLVENQYGQLSSRWRNVTTKYINAHNKVTGRRNSAEKPRVKLYYCQCSYEERAEKERIKNIRRRHASQTNTGPLDFNKLKRQISITSSKSMV